MAAPDFKTAGHVLYSQSGGQAAAILDELVCPEQIPSVGLVLMSSALVAHQQTPSKRLVKLRTPRWLSEHDSCSF